MFSMSDNKIKMVKKAKAICSDYLKCLDQLLAGECSVTDACVHLGISQSAFIYHLQRNEKDYPRKVSGISEEEFFQILKEAQSPFYHLLDDLLGTSDYLIEIPESSQKAFLNTIKKKLSKRRWKYIKMRYGFENEQPHSNAEISKELNLSRQAVSIGMHRAFEEIKEPSNMILLFPEYEKHVKALEEVADYKKEREQYEVLTQKKLRETTFLNDDAKNLIEMLLKGISVEQIKCYLENHTSLETDTLLTQSLRCIPEFQLRTYNILMRNGINTMGKLCQHSFKSLAKIKGMGPTTLNDILYVLKLYGISLKS